MSKNYRAELVGVFGDPVEENPTGVMEEAAFEALGLPFRYLTIRVIREDLPAAIQAVRAFGMRGINLTIPHKIAVIPYLDELTEAAEIIGAVNTVVNEGGRLIGENTDGKGMLESLQENGCQVKGKNLAIIGAGGAARAIAVEAALAGAKKVTIINRTMEKARELAEMIRHRTGVTAEALPLVPRAPVPERTDILVNGTSIGLYPDVGSKPDIDYAGITPEMVVADVVFNDPNTLFLRTAQAQGAKTINGLGMLANQGAVNFTLWTGKDAPKAIMEQTLRREFGLG
ncbi:MAG: shikimate dehydrogenase [Eubacteriales bacterium]|jgi:shikimate dehydrogenase|nr:shikimate dehydrogenase [Eubacteriales bacterium]MDD3109649.1 shikimate dehydrogenase [Eubacteriales bacterium]MDD3572095.1 shikimate dehydrogenase [Eubacteriales bacterium]MDD4135175.1 shikimate dehydrogenase [Eubacteriales bacterium]NLO13226.1 shikimate dehydrogenase [Clostridiales bacterium]